MTTVEWSTGLDYWSATPTIVNAHNTLALFYCLKFRETSEKHQDCARLVPRVCMRHASIKRETISSNWIAELTSTKGIS